MVTEITTSIYSRTSSETFSEKFVAYTTTSLKNGALQSQITTAEHDGPITQIRIDFSRTPVIFYLDSLTVFHKNNVPLFILTPDYDWLHNSADMTVKPTSNGLLVECLSNEPSLLIPIPEGGSDTSLVVSFTVRSVFGTSSGDRVDNAEVLALNYLLSEQEDLSNYINKLKISLDEKWEKSQLNNKNIFNELEIIKHLSNKQNEDFHEFSAKNQEAILKSSAEHFSALSENIASDSEELKIYVRTGVNALKRNIDDLNAIPHIQKLSEATQNNLDTILKRISENERSLKEISIVKNSIEFSHLLLRKQELILSEIFDTEIPHIKNYIEDTKTERSYNAHQLNMVLDNLANIKQSKDMNTAMAARIMAANYRYRGDENFSQLPGDLSSARELINNLRSELLETRGTLEMVLRSRSWYLTKPLRFALRILGKIFRKLH